jgi:hypothetical protein
LALNMRHTTSDKCGACHPIGGQIPDTTTFWITGLDTHFNEVLDMRADLPVASCEACHGLPPATGTMGLIWTNPSGYNIIGIHPTGAPYMTACGVCHVIGPGNPITMDAATHGDAILNFVP